MLQSKGHAVNFLKFQELFSPYFVFMHLFHKILCGNANSVHSIYIEGWAQDYGNSNIFLKPLFRGNLDPFVNNANLGAIAHTSNGT